MYSKERNGFFSVFDVITALEDDFLAASMEIVHSAKDAYYNDADRDPEDPVTLVVKPTILTDIAFDETPWCIVFRASTTPFRYDKQRINVDKYSSMFSGTSLGGSIHVYVCTPNQIIDMKKGIVASDSDFPDGRSGGLNCFYTTIENWQNSTQRTGPFNDKLPPTFVNYRRWEIPFIEWFASEEIIGQNHTSRFDFRPEHAGPTASPASYLLNVTNHGVSFAFWKETENQEGKDHVWFNVQRLVNAEGNVMDIGKKPVFCTYFFGHRGLYKGDSSSSFEGYMETYRDPYATKEEKTNARAQMDAIEGADYRYLFNRFVVCEKDVYTPAPPTPADQDTTDSAAIVNSSRQASITESSKYVVSFPNTLNTQRFVYTDQLDMMGVTSADVIGQSVDLDLEVFGGIKRYRGIPASEPFSRGMRIMLLVHEQFEDGFNKSVVENLAEGDLLNGGGNDPDANPFGKPPRSQAELGMTFDNSNIATFDPDAINEPAE